MSKGSRQRPCNKKVFDENYERIFEKNQGDIPLIEHIKPPDGRFKFVLRDEKYFVEWLEEECSGYSSNTTLSPEAQYLTEREEKEKNKREKEELKLMGIEFRKKMKIEEEERDRIFYEAINAEKDCVPDLTEDEFNAVTKTFFRRLEDEMSNSSCNDVCEDEFPKSVCETFKYHGDSGVFEAWKRFFTKLYSNYTTESMV